MTFEDSLRALSMPPMSAGMPTLPVNSLPIPLQEVIWQVHTRTKAPFELIAACSLGIMSMACQDLCDVSPKEGLRSPLSLYLMVLAVSGERKSTVDSMLMSPVRELEREWHAAFQEASQKFEDEMLLWAIEFKEMEKQFTRALKTGDGVEESRRALLACKGRKPSEPVQRRMIINDITKASVKRELGTGCPTLSLCSDEAGSILDADLFRDTPFLNSLWSAKPIEIDRASGPSFQIEDVRVGAMLQVQPELYAGYVERQGRAARASGFFARTLICQPQSTIGFRFEPPVAPQQQTDDKLSWFHQRVKELLDLTFKRREKKLERVCLTFSPQAFAMWHKEYCRIESLIGPSGALKDFKDYASKQLEHVSKIAGVLEAFMTGGPIISESTMSTAICIANYFLNSFIRLHADKKMPEEVEDAFLLETWLRENHHRVGFNAFPRIIIRRDGPNRLRNKVRLERALLALQMRGVVSFFKSGRKDFVSYNGNYVSGPGMISGYPGI